MRITGIIIVLVLACLGLSWTVGSQVEKTLETYAFYVDQQPGYTAEIKDFNHGLIHSTATLVIRPDLNMLMADIPEVERAQLEFALGAFSEGVNIMIDIDQGPFIVRNGFYAGLYRIDFNLDSESMIVRQYVPGNIDINDHLNTEWRMGYFGKGMLAMDFPEFTHNMGGVDFTSGGADIKMGLTGYGKGFDLDGRVYPFSMTSPNGEELLVDGMTMEGKGQMATGGNLIKDTEIKVTLPSVTGNGGELVRINDVELEMKVDADEDEGTFDLTYGMSTGLISAPGMDEPLNNLAMSFAGHDLSIDGFNRFYSTYNQAIEMMQQDPFGAQSMIADGITYLFEGSPVFELEELSFDMGSDIEMDLRADISTTEDFSFSMLQINPVLALGAIQASLDLEMSQAFMEMAIGMYIDNALAGLQGMDQAFIDQMRQQQMAQIGAMTQQFVLAGYLTQQGSNYLMNASLTDGQILVNGTPLPISF